MKPGDKVICINDFLVPHFLTINRTYIIKSIYNTTISVLSNDNRQHWYNIDRFMSIREYNLNKLTNERR